MVSNDSPDAGAPHRPPMNSPKVPPLARIQSSAGPLASGAGPHSIVSKMLATVVAISDHRMPVGGAVAAGHEILELPLDVGEQGRRTEAEAVGVEPGNSQLFLHEDEPLERSLRAAYTPPRPEAPDAAGAARVLADNASVDETLRQRRVARLLPRRCLDEVGAGHHRRQACASHVGQCRELTRGEDDLHVGRAARLAERDDLLV